LNGTIAIVFNALDSNPAPDDYGKQNIEDLMKEGCVGIVFFGKVRLLVAADERGEINPLGFIDFAS
jgi:hypothetical protein